MMNEELGSLFQLVKRVESVVASFEVREQPSDVNLVISFAEITPVLRSISRACFCSFAAQTELISYKTTSLITTLLVKASLLDLQHESNFLLLDAGFEAVTSIISGASLRSDDRGLIECYEGETGKLTKDVLQSCFQLYVRKRDGSFLPPLTSQKDATDDGTISIQSLLSLVERCVRLLENLLLHDAMRHALCQEHSICEVLIRCLREFGPLKASIVEHTLAALINLVEATDCCVLNYELGGAQLLSLPECEPEASGAAESGQLNTFESPCPASSKKSASKANISTVKRIVTAGGCEAVLDALHRYGNEEVGVVDCALCLVQALAVRDTDAVLRFEQYQQSESGVANAVIASVSHNNLHRVDKSAIKPIVDIAADLNGSVAILVKVVSSHSETSVTVAESGIGAIGCVVLQSRALLLHLLSNNGFHLVMSVLEKWGASSTSISAKCARILTEIVEVVRLCRKELHRIECYHNPTSADHNSTQDTSLMTKNTRERSPGGSRQLEPELSVVHANKVCDSKSGTVEDLFECDDNDFEAQKIDIGVEGATPAYVYKVLDCVDINSLLMDAENGALERERSKHEGAAAKRRVGLKAASSVALGAHRLKSTSSSHETLPRLLSSPQSLSQLNSVLSRTVSMRATGSTLGSEMSLLRLAKPHEKKAPFDPVFIAALKMLDQHGEHCLEVLHPALRLLLTVCDLATFPHHWAQVSAHNGCAIITKALRNSDLFLPPPPSDDMGAVNTVITAQIGLQILQQLTLCDTGSKEKLCQLHAHKIVVELLHTHGAHSVVVATLCADVFVLLYDGVHASETNEGNVTACNAIVLLLTLYSDERQGNERFVASAMHMLRILTKYKPNQRLLGEFKACSEIVRVLRLYTSHERTFYVTSIALHGLTTIAHLAEHEANQSRLTKCGACKLVLELTERLGTEEESVTTEGLRAMGVLARGSKGLLGELGACVLVVRLLSQYVTTAVSFNENILYLSSLAVHYLCVEYEDNKHRFRQLSVVPTLKALLADRRLTHGTIDAMKRALNVVAY